MDQDQNEYSQSEPLHDDNNKPLNAQLGERDGRQKAEVGSRIRKLKALFQIKRKQIKYLAYSENWTHESTNNYTNIEG